MDPGKRTTKVEKKRVFPMERISRGFVAIENAYLLKRNFCNKRVL